MKHVAGLVVLLLLLSACRATPPGTPAATAAPEPPLPSASPLPPGRPLAVQRLFGQETLEPRFRYGAWLTGLVAAGSDLWLVSRFPAAILRYRDGAIERPFALGVSLASFTAVAQAGRDLLISDVGRARLYRYAPNGDGKAERIAGSPTILGTDPLPSSTGDGGQAAAATLDVPVALAVGPGGDVYVAEAGSGKVRRIAPDGVITTVLSDLAVPGALAMAPDGTLLVAESGAGRVLAWDPGRGARTLAEGFDTVMAVAADKAGTVWVSDSTPQRLWRLRPDGGRDVFEVPGIEAPGGLVVGEALWVIDQATNSIWRGAVPD